MECLVWKNRSLLLRKKSSFFLVNHSNWVCTSDRLERRGWTNGKQCPLWWQKDETAIHLIFKCRYSIHIWNMIKDWMRIQNLIPRLGMVFLMPNFGGVTRSLATGVEEKS
jgi:hypothetical protein